MTALAETFASNREKLEASGAAGGDGKVGDENKATPKENAHTLEGHRQTMAGVVPRLYQLLSNAVEAEEAQGPGAEGEASRGVVTEGIRAVLHEVPWLWVGDAFVPADQVRGFCCFALRSPFLRLCSRTASVA